MRAALTFISVGFLLCFGLGHYLGLSIAEIICAIIASNVSGFLCLMMVTFGHQNKWFKKNIIPGPGMTWLVFTLQYFAVLVLLTPAIQDWHRFLILALPLIFTTGICIFIFGPIRDWLIKVQQTKNR